jgi:hypothetical protein
METKEIVFNAMKKSSNPLKAGEIAELTGIDKKEVDKAMKTLLKEAKIFSPKKCYYSPK